MLCELVFAQALEMPAEVLAHHEEGIQSQDEGRTLKVLALEYCLVLEAGCEDPDLGVDSGVLLQQADAGGQVPKVYGVEVGMDRKRPLNEHLKGKGGPLDEMDGAILVLRLCGAQSLTRWRVAAVEEAAALS